MTNEEAQEEAAAFGRYKKLARNLLGSGDLPECALALWMVVLAPPPTDLELKAALMMLKARRAKGDS